MKRRGARLLKRALLSEGSAHQFFGDVGIVGFGGFFLRACDQGGGIPVGAYDFGGDFFGEGALSFDWQGDETFTDRTDTSCRIKGSIVFGEFAEGFDSVSAGVMVRAFGSNERGRFCVSEFVGCGEGVETGFPGLFRHYGVIDFRLPVAIYLREVFAGVVAAFDRYTDEVRGLEIGEKAFIGFDEGGCVRFEAGFCVTAEEAPVYEATRLIRDMESGSANCRTPVVAFTAHALKGDDQNVTSQAWMVTSQNPCASPLWSASFGSISPKIKGSMSNQMPLFLFRRPHNGEL